jgi:hypothetical protein
MRVISFMLLVIVGGVVVLVAFVSLLLWLAAKHDRDTEG